MSTSEQTQPLFTHLLELRTRLLHSIISVVVIFIALVSFSNSIYAFVAKPLMQRMPAGATMIATDVASPFITPIKLTLVVSLFIAVPYILYQIWGFIAPGLYKHEKRMVVPLLVSSSLLFYVGVAFAYYVVCPLAFAFFTHIAPAGVEVATDISSYLNFVLSLFLAFGVAFEIPVAIILLCWTGITSAAALKQKRPYIIVGVFVVAMMLTPPDVMSQTMLAIPMLGLFEIGLFCSRFYTKKREDVVHEEEEDEDESSPSA